MQTEMLCEDKNIETKKEVTLRGPLEKTGVFGIVSLTIESRESWINPEELPNYDWG